MAGSTLPSRLEKNRYPSYHVVKELCSYTFASGQGDRAVKQRILLATALIFILAFASPVQAQEANTSQVTTIAIGTDSSWKSMDAAVKGWTSAGFDDSWWPDSWESAYPLPGLAQARAIWYPETPVPLTAYFRKTFDIDGVEVISGRVHVKISAYDVEYGMPDAGKLSIYINDQYVDDLSSGGYMNNWSREKELDISSYLTPGKNVIAVRVEFSEWVTQKPTDSKYNWWGLDATIRYLMYQNEPPLANAGVDQTVTTGAGVILDGSSSRDPDGSIVSYEWDLGDGTSSVGRTVTHVYSKEGVYTVVLTVADNSGTEATDTVTIKIISVAPEIILNPTSGEANTSIVVSGTGFGKSKQVIIYFNTIEVARATTDTHGNFGIIFDVLEMEAGIYNVDASDEADNIARAKFTMAVPASIPTTITPWWSEPQWFIPILVALVLGIPTLVVAFRRRH